MAVDLRCTFFGGSRWYEKLTEPSDVEAHSAWYLAKGPASEWWAVLLNAAFSYAIEKGVDELYTQRFAGIRANDLLAERAASEGRMVSFPIWEIAHELVVALYLDRVLGWTLVSHEPRGRGERLGDWEFRTLTGRQTFVEVKSLAERAPVEAGVYSRPSYAPRLRMAIARAYKQLPLDDRSTLVILVGDDLLSCPFGLVHSDLFAALYGQFEVRMTVMRGDPKVTYAGPSFREMLVHGSKHRRLGTVAGLRLRGCHDPNPFMYAIHNPYAHPHHQLPADDFGDILQFAVDAEMHGREIGGLTGPAAWLRIAQKGDSY